ASAMTAGDTDKALIRTESFKKSLSAAAVTTTLSDYDRSKSETFFDIHLGKGDEIADYSVSYNTANTETKSASSNYYKGNVRASAMTAGDTDKALIRTESFKKSLSAAAVTTTLSDYDRSKSETFFDIHLGKGDEIADYSVSYNTANTETKSASINYYEGNVRASAMTAGDTDKALIRTESFKKSLSAAAVTTTLSDYDRSKSETFFDIHLGKGDEIADYSVSYNTANTETKSASINYYEGNVRASAMTAGDTDKALIRTESFKKSLSAAAVTTTLSDYDRSKSETFFDIHLGKGDEIADYSVSYNTANTETKSASINYYEGNVRASAMTAGDTDKALIRTESFKKSLSAAAVTTTLSDYDRSKSETFFDIHLGKGDEIADYSVSYNTANTETKSASINYYEGNVR